MISTIMIVTITKNETFLPSGEVTVAPASVAINQPAAKSQIWGPNSKYASSIPAATWQISKAADPTLRNLQNNENTDEIRLDWCCLLNAWPFYLEKSQALNRHTFTFLFPWNPLKSSICCWLSSINRRWNC